ncbi:outer envelope pore protein 21, chloroplastic [Lolium perenne]|uniref:outer envelope pore protein 21, chloroplastic n=1 Tax=Lolium perenne TaxID=4522 RepID=UPI0021F5B059|nr:outer envelope pore protein 21, chloroplastic-like [Lolium perenne]
MVMETSLRLRGADSTNGQQLRATDSTADQRPRGANSTAGQRRRGANSTASQRPRGTDSTAVQQGLRIHAKQKLPLAANSLLQAHAEIDTSTGNPSHLALLARHFFPELSANVGAGVRLENGNIFRYSLRGKKAVAFTPDGLLGLNIKGRLLADKDFKPRTGSGAVELAWTILDFRKGQDVRLKAGYELYRKMPYFQVRENNWTLNGYMDGKWDVRFDM